MMTLKVLEYLHLKKGIESLKNFRTGHQMLIQILSILLFLLETLEAELKDLKPRSLTEEARLSSIKENLTEARLKVKKLKHENSVLKNKVSILEEDLDL